MTSHDQSSVIAQAVYMHSAVAAVESAEAVAAVEAVSNSRLLPLAHAAAGAALLRADEIALPLATPPTHASAESIA